MQRYDHVVVGSGVSGLTAALLLALGGKSVALVERARMVGGSLCRFRRKGVPFDTGFHFTGGFSPDGLMVEMLDVLGLRDAITPVFLDPDRANSFLFEDSGSSFLFPSGIDRIAATFDGYFPSEREGIRRYFDMVKAVCDRTVSMDIENILLSGDVLEEDFLSLQEVVDDLFDDSHLKALLGAFCMCYGVAPREVSFANHSRMCIGLYESVARVAGGGDAVIRAFLDRFSSLGVDVLCGREIVECTDIRGDHAHRFVFADGEEIGFDTCVFTIHPKCVLDILPHRLLSPAFRSRVADFEASAGFFSVFGVLAEHEGNEGIEGGINSLFPTTDVNALLFPDHEGDSALVMVHSVEQVKGAMVRTISAFEPSFTTEVESWWDSQVGRRPADYAEYKAAKAARIRERMGRLLPGGAEQFTPLDSASVLTFRDYLNSPDGSAYGVKQKLGQFNLFGKLPVRNMYAAGQSSILPGVVGAMMSAFFVARAVMGKELFGRLVAGRKGL